VEFCNGLGVCGKIPYGCSTTVRVRFFIVLIEAVHHSTAVVREPIVLLLL